MSNVVPLYGENFEPLPSFTICSFSNSTISLPVSTHNALFQKNKIYMAIIALTQN
jgi:hypothetical protein